MIIVALGTTFFVGIKATAPDMYETAAEYFKEYNLMDLRIQSPAGLTAEDLNAVTALGGVQYAAGQKFVDALVRVNGEIEADIDGTQISTRAYSISPQNISNFLSGIDDGTYINRPQLIEGRFPSSVGECLVDASRLSTPDSFKLGSTITLEQANGAAVQELNTQSFTVVGIIRSPYYLSFERGNTTIGSGKIGTFIYVPEEAFTADYFSEIYVTIAGADEFEPYSDEYFEFLAPYADEIASIADYRVSLRTTQLKPELEKKIAEAEKTIANSSDEATKKLSELDDTIKQLENLVAAGAEQLEAAEKEFNEKFADAENNVNNNTAEYNAALQQLSEMQALYNENNAEYLKKSNELKLSQSTYDDLYSQWQQADTSLSYAQGMIDTTKSLITAGEAVADKLSELQDSAAGNEQIQSVINMMKITYPDLYNAVKSLTAQGLASEIASSLAPYLEQQKASLAKQESEISTKRTAVDALGAQLSAKKTELEAATYEMAAAKAELEAAEKELSEMSAKLSSAGFDIQSGGLQLQIEKITAQAKLNELRTQVQNAPQNLATAKAAREEALKSLDAGLLSAQQQLSSAKSLYGKLDSISWNISDRNGTPGYSGYGQTVENIKVLSNIFPIFFFIISSMICLTTMTRMVEEDRVLIGTYKALGYTTASIISKYVIYSLSACIIGTAIGVFAMANIFPFAINSAYGIMYSLPPLIYVFPWKYSLIGLRISLACTTLATVIAIARELHTKPAVLMRPKAPKAGKRILLERISGLWRRLSFTSKVTLRNLFRNKQRFIMTLLGIAGCSALLLASLGMYNSISAILSEQYGETAISKYDFQLVFSSPQNSDEHSEEYNAAQSDVRVESLMLTSMKSMTGSGDKNSRTLDVYVVVPENPAQLNSYIDLRDRKTGAKYQLDDSGAVITEKLAADTKTEVGDSITFTDSDGKAYSVKVSAIAENYTFHYIYITENLYKQVTGSAPDYEYAMGRIASSFKNSSSTSIETTKGLLATDLMKTSGITAVAYTSDTTEAIGNITQALSVVIFVFFISALILAFIVLYNLSNINIIERTRELATLKVLGFVDKEVSRYIYRENIIVSVFGILFGGLLGIGLHYLLITFTAIDTVMYGQHISWYSYIATLGITVLIIALVNIILHHKLKKVDMVLSLKSVE